MVGGFAGLLCSIIQPLAVTKINSLVTRLALGINDIVPKTANADLIEAAIKIVQSGGRYFPPEMTVETSDPQLLASAGLSPKQAEVLALISKGLTNKDIAKSLGVAPSTVNTHIEKLVKKFGAKSGTALSAIASARTVSA